MLASVPVCVCVRVWQNSMLKNLNILAESKGYTKQGQPQPRQRIPLKRSMTASSLPRGQGNAGGGGKRRSADQSPALVPRERLGGRGGGGRSTAAGTRSSGKSVRVAADEKEVADGSYARLEELDEEDEQGVQDELDVGRVTPLSGIVIGSGEALSAQPSVAGSRSRSEATYDSNMAVFTPAGQPSRRRAFFPAGDTPVLVEETMDDGSVRVIVAQDTMAAVQHMQQQAEQQRHTDEANSSSISIAAQARHKRDEEPLDAISSFAAKLLDFNSHSSSNNSKEHDADTHAAHDAQLAKQQPQHASQLAHSQTHRPHDEKPHSSRPSHSGQQHSHSHSHSTPSDDSQLSEARAAAAQRGSSRRQRAVHHSETQTATPTPQSGTSNTSGDSDESSEEEEEAEEVEEEEDMPHSNRMTGLPLIPGFPS